MNLASILLKKILVDSDIDAWAALKKHYLPKPYAVIHDNIQKHISTYGSLPNFTELKLSIRSPLLLSKVESIESVDYIETDCTELIDYIKNEFVQVEAISKIDKFLDTTIYSSTAEEVLDALRAMILEIESQVDFVNPEDDMSKMELFDSEDLLLKSQALGLNKDYDEDNLFSPSDLVLIGGKRGAGKSLTCANIVSEAYINGKSSIYFTIEMPSRQILHRICSISTGIPASVLRRRDLTMPQWEKVAEWWSGRFEGGKQAYKEYLKHNNFDELHKQLIKTPLIKPQIEIIYDAGLTLGRIRAELDKLCYTLEPTVVVVDYINKVKTGLKSRNNQFDWTEQMAIADDLKKMAQDYNVLLVSPYQIDATGEARMAKGILDPADIAFTLDTHNKADNAITFSCVKRRNGPELDFTSYMDWDTLKIGPDSAILVQEGEDGEESEQASEAF